MNFPPAAAIPAATTATGSTRSRFGRRWSLNAGLKTAYESDFTEPYFLLAAQAEGEGYRVDVSFVMPNTMEDEDTAELTCAMTKADMKALIDELDALCAKFPDRT